MANKQRGQIAVEFEGKPLDLVLDVDAICRLESLEGRPINPILADLSDPETMRMTTVRNMFLVMMLQQKPDATLADASAVIDGLAGKYEAVMADAVHRAFPDANPDADAAPGK